MQIHYFQRYHSKENVDTANTMLLLSRLYTFSSNKFHEFLRGYILNDDSNTDLIFTLQEKCKGSVPDATISQKSFKIVVETKLYGQFVEQQLIEHLKSFDLNTDYKVLLTLDPRPMKKKTLDDFEIHLKDHNRILEKPILHRNLTFEALIEGIKSVIDDRDYEFISVLNDYEEYCFSQKLIPDEWKWMRAITAGTTFEINKKLDIYYDGADRGFSGHDYIGLYTQKSVRAIGKIDTIVVAEQTEKGLKYICEKGILTDEHKTKIQMAIDDSQKYDYSLENTRYFFVEKFYDTDYKKVTPNPIQRSKFMDLSEIIGMSKLPPTEEIAKLLRNKVWK